MYVIVYNDSKDKTISRLYSSYQTLKPGDITGLNWEVITIQELYKKQFFTNETLREMMIEDKEKIERYNSLINKIINIIDTLLNA